MLAAQQLPSAGYLFSPQYTSSMRPSLLSWYLHPWRWFRRPKSTDHGELSGLADSDHVAPLVYGKYKLSDGTSITFDDIDPHAVRSVERAACGCLTTEYHDGDSKYEPCLACAALRASVACRELADRLREERGA